jgi:DNA invertase Pin-like site-specific DNA recombinase
MTEWRWTMRAVIYTRTSTSRQSTAMQLAPLKTLVERSGYELVEIIEDEGVSGTIRGNNRDGMNKLMMMVNRREVDVVCVYSVDRIGRKLTDILSIAEHLNEKGVGLVIHKNGIDTTTTHGKHMLSFFALIAEMERDFITSRIADGMAVAKSKGKQIGRRSISNKTKQEIISLREQGMSMNKIAKELSVGNSQVMRICQELSSVAA